MSIYEPSQAKPKDLVSLIRYIFAELRRISIAIGDNNGRVRWAGLWSPIFYKKNDMARDGLWLGVANKDTLDRLAPQATGATEYGLSDTPAFGTLSNASAIDAWHEYTFLRPVNVDQIRVYVPEVSATTTYRLYIIDVNRDLVDFIDLSGLIANQWNIVSQGSRFFIAGDVIRLQLSSVNTGSSTNISGGWRNDGVDNGVAPNTSGFNRNQQNTLVRIDKTDLDTNDRSSELSSVISGSKIRFVQTNDSTRFMEFTATGAAVDGGTFFSYAVTLSDQGVAIVVGETYTTDIDVPVAQSTDYSQLAGHWATDPDYADVTGFKDFDGVPQAGVEDAAFGVDMRITRQIASSDWDIAAYSG